MRLLSFREVSQHHERDDAARAAMLHAGAPPSTSHASSDVAVLTAPRTRPPEAGPVLEGTEGILFPVNNRDASTAVSASAALGREPHKIQARPATRSPEIRLHGHTREPTETQPSHRFTEHRVQFDSTPRRAARLHHAHRVAGRASLENTLRMQGRCPSALPDAAIADDDFAAFAQRIQLQQQGRATATQACGP